MKRALIDENNGDKNNNIVVVVNYINVLRLVILNAIEEWTPRWFYVVLVQLTCRSLSWYHDNNNNNQEVTHRAAQWITRLIPSATPHTNIDIAVPTQQLDHRDAFCRLYARSHRFLAHVAEESEALYNDYKYEAHGAVVSCSWCPDHIALQFEDGVNLKIVAECRKWSDNAWFGFTDGGGGGQYDRRYQELLVGQRIKALRQVTAGPRYRPPEVLAEFHLSQSVDRGIYVIQTTEGMQFPFTRRTKYVSWPDGWITLQWAFPSTPVPVKPTVKPTEDTISVTPSVCIVTGAKQCDIVAYLADDNQPHRPDHIFLYDGDDISRHHAFCPWSSDVYFLNFVKDRVARGESVWFASSLFVVHGWRPFQAFLERIRDRLSPLLARSLDTIVVADHTSNSDVTQANEFKERFDIELCRPVKVVDTHLIAI